MSNSTPSIKGSAMASVVDDVRSLRDRGRVSADRLEAALEAGDLELLDAKIQPALWYPIESYRRLSELLLAVEGRGNAQYLVDRGARAAERIWEAGLYVQLEHGEARARSAREQGHAIPQRDARLIVSLSGALFNFTRWSYHAEDDDREARIDVNEAEAFPDVSMHAARGFLEYIVSRLRGVDTPVRAERPTPDRIVFRFDR